MCWTGRPIKGKKGRNGGMKKIIRVVERKEYFLVWRKEGREGDMKDYKRM